MTTVKSLKVGVSSVSPFVRANGGIKDEPSFCYVSVRVVSFNSVPNVLKWEQLQNTLPLCSPSFTCGGGF